MCLLILAGLALVAYANSLDAPFLLDDRPQIEKAGTIRSLDPVAMWRSARPTVTLTLAINYAMGALGVTVYHVTNLLLHLGCSVLLFFWARWTLGLAALRERYAAPVEAMALAVAAIFLVHPLQTGAVTYVIQRAEIMASIALIAFVWVAVRATDAWRAAPALLAISLLGGMSKPSFAIAPLLLAIYDWCIVADGDWRAMARRWPIYAVAIAVVAVGTWAGWPTGTGNTAGLDVKGISPLDYLQMQFGVLVYYLTLLLWPHPLCFDCGYKQPWPVLDSFLGDAVVAPAVMLAVLGIAALALRRRAPLFTLAVLGSAVVLAPTSSLLPLTDIYFEHRLYLCVGLFALALVPDAARALMMLGEARGWSIGRIRRSMAGVAAIVVAVLALVTIARNHTYADEIRLLEDTLAKAPGSARSVYNLGNEYKRQGRRSDAIAMYRKSLEADPDYLMAWVNLGSEYMKEDRNEEAAEAFRSGVTRHPEVAMPRRNLARALWKLERREEAVAEALEAARLDPADPKGRKLLAQVYQGLGRRSEALAEWKVYLGMVPNDSEARDAVASLGG
jgi:tetratricopeptide (TPR) repeat protein